MESDKTICNHIAESLDAFHDGELPAAEQTTVEKHLTACTVCVDKLAEIDRVVHTLKTMPRAEMPAGLSGKLDNLIDQQNKKVITFQPRVWASIAAAAAVVAIVFGARYMTPTTGGGTTVPTTAMHTQTVPTPIQQKDVMPEPEVANNTSKTTSAPETVKHEQQKKHDNVVAQRPEVKVADRPLTPSTATSAQQAKGNSSEEELAELPSVNNAFNEAVGLSTDEDGLYDLQM